MRTGLAPHTGEIIERLSLLECVKPYVLVGGTALSIQLQTRLSEDLDFQRWKESKDDTLDIGWPNIERELTSVGNVQQVDILGFDQQSSLSTESRSRSMLLHEKGYPLFKKYLFSTTSA